MKKTRFSATERAEVLQAARGVLDRFEDADLDLARASVAASPDGYPTNSMPGPGQPGSVSDRVLAVVDARVDGTDHASRAFGYLVDAYYSLCLADMERKHALPPASAPVAGTIDWCRSCSRAQVMSPVMPSDVALRKYGVLASTSGLCEWCWAWSAEHDAIPPVGLVERRGQGVRITSKVIAEVLASEARDRREQKSKKKGRKR